MLRHLGLIAVCACIVASVGCDGGKLPDTAPPSPSASDGQRGIRRPWSTSMREAPSGTCGYRSRAWHFPTGVVWDVPAGLDRMDGSFRPTLQRPVEMAHLPSDSISRVLGRMSDLKSPFRLNTTIRAVVLSEHCLRSSGDQDISDARYQARRID